MNCTKLILAPAFGIVLLAGAATSADLIVDVERLNSGNTPPRSGGLLAENALAFVDRSHRYVTIPPELLGAEYVMVANDDKGVPDYALELTLSQPATVFLFFDNRLGHSDASLDSGRYLEPDLAAAGMHWALSLGFADTLMDIVIHEMDATQTMRWSSVYSRDFGPGVMTLGPQYDTSGPWLMYRNMYGVAAAIPEPATLALLAMGLLVLARGRRT